VSIFNRTSRNDFIFLSVDFILDNRIDAFGFKHDTSVVFAQLGSASLDIKRSLVFNIPTVGNSIPKSSSARMLKYLAIRTKFKLADDFNLMLLVHDVLQLL